MANEELAMKGYKCKFRYTRYSEVWGTCFPLYLHGELLPNRKGWKSYWVSPNRPYEMIVNARYGATSNCYHWVVFGIDDEGVPQEGLYRAGTADYPPPLLEFPFPQHAAFPFSPFVAEPVPPGEEDPDYDPVYTYIRVRAIVGNAEDNVSFTLVFPGWLAIDQENCCSYELEAPTIKVVNYQLRGQPARLCIGAVISDAPEDFDIGTLPPEYDGKRHPGVGWYVYKQSGTEKLSTDPNNPTIFTINFTQTPP